MHKFGDAGPGDWDTVPAMRWDRLFEELEAQAGDLELEERDALVDELRDGEWAETSWRSLLGGHVVLEVSGSGRVEGQAVLVNEQLIQLRGEHVDHVVDARAVLAISSAEERAAGSSAVVAALGWGHVFRALRREGDSVRVWRTDGHAADGTVSVVGRDFVRLRTESGREQLIPFDVVALVSGRT